MNEKVIDTGIRFDGGKILRSLGDAINPQLFLQGVRLFVNHPEGNPILYSRNGAEYNSAAKSFATDYPDLVLNKLFDGTYLADVIDYVTGFLEGDGLVMGRIRVLKLDPGSSLDLHIDDDVIRYHIPLITSKWAFFINGDAISAMPEVGALYRYDTSELHAAINLHDTEPRLHLVFDVRK